MGVESAVAYSQLPEFKSSFIFRLRLRSSRKGEARRDHRSGCTKSFHGFLLWREVLWLRAEKIAWLPTGNMKKIAAVLDNAVQKLDSADVPSSRVAWRQPTARAAPCAVSLTRMLWLNPIRSHNGRRLSAAHRGADRARVAARIFAAVPPEKADRIVAALNRGRSG
jgi:hypothetical protein